MKKKKKYSACYYNTETCAREGNGVACASLRLEETFMCSCCRPTEAARFCERKCANNRQLIVAGIQSVFTTCMRSSLPCHTYTQNNACATYIYANTDRHIFLYTETVTCMHVLHEDEICFTLMHAIFKQL